MSRAVRRAWLLTNVVVTLALLPALFPDAGSATEIDAGAPRLVAVSAPPSTMLVPTTTTTVAPPPAPAAVEKAVAEPKPAPVPAPSTTTTTQPPRPTTTTTTQAPPPPPPAQPAPSGSETGRATWYDHQPGICAHRTLPFGTVVTVNAVNGKSVQCTVGDRGPFVDGYVIDLHWREFEQLAPRSAGRIDVTITW